MSSWIVWHPSIQNFASDIVPMRVTGRPAISATGPHLSRALGGSSNWTRTASAIRAWFPALWRARDDASAILGRRVWRDDGIARWGVSRVVSLVVWLHTGCWLRDANVPYRLIRADALKAALAEVPAGAFFCNILLAVRLRRRQPIHWVPIRFRRRAAGQSTLRMSALVQFAWRLSTELRALPALEVEG